VEGRVASLPERKPVPSKEGIRTFFQVTIETTSGVLERDGPGSPYSALARVLHAQ